MTSIPEDNVITRFTDNQLVVQAAFSDLDALRSIPGLSWSAAKKVWYGDCSPSLAQSLITTFSGRLLCSDAQRLKALAAQAGEANRVRSATELPDIPNAKLTPWRHQKDEYWAMVRQPATLVYFGLGTGKTAPVVWYIQNYHVKATLVVCPLSVIDVWLSEFPKHATVPVTVWCQNTPFPAPHGILLVPLNKGAVERKAVTALEAFKYNGSVVIICNYESAWRPPLNQTFPSAHFDLLVMDEGHKLQSPGSRVSKFFRALAKTVGKRVALTGTPCPNGPLTIYGLYRALDSGIFGTSFAKFRDEFAVMGGYQNHEVVGYKNVEEYNRRFYSIAVHADRSVLTLPEAITVQRTASLSASAMKIYKQLEKDLVAQIGTGTVTAANGLVKLLRLSQLTGGWLTPDGDIFNGGPSARVEPTRVDTAKQELLADVLDDLPKDEPVVIFFRFTADAQSIHEVCTEQGRKYNELSGQKNELQSWQKDGQVLAVQIATGGLGIDLTKAAYCVYYSVGYSLSEYEQSLARVHRPGQTRSVTYIQLIMQNTVDEKVYAALQAKADVVESVLRDMTDKEAAWPEEGQ